MKLLVVNDDGIHAPGLGALLESTAKHGQTTIIAPHQERSGMSHAITVNRPLRLTQVKQGYVLDGTPADCVKMGLLGLKLQPDFVLSGINGGANLGTDVLYSGTVSAALEAVLLGVPALAFSLCGSSCFLETATHYVSQLLFEKPGILFQPDLIPKDGILNINIPALPIQEIKGLRITRLGVRKYKEILEERVDPRGVSYYWMGGRPAFLEAEEKDIDLVAVEQGYISVTPLQFDLTNHGEIERLKGVFQTEYSTKEKK
ncbi:MAG: 5'/3'-nucleotidase SurE [Firmicutes bacterium]|nr:5'/3'-nucleotidase SurE [Bacillota bacterium]